MNAPAPLSQGASDAPRTLLDELVWPRARLAEALGALARTLGAASGRVPPAPSDAEPADAVERYLDGAAEALGVEAEALAVKHGDTEALLLGSSPALIGLAPVLERGAPPREQARRFLVLLRTSGGRAVLLDPELRERALPVHDVAAALRLEVERPLLGEVNGLLDRAGVPPRRRDRARAGLMGMRIARRQVAVAWAIRRRPGGAFLPQLVEAGVARRALWHLVAFALALALDVTAWALVGRGALTGRLDWGWLLAWGLALLSAVPLQAAGTWLAGVVAVDLGALLKRRLLAGALSLDPEEIRHQGAGGHLSRVIEGEVVESLGLNAATVAIAGVLELCVAAVLLVAGTGLLGVVVVVAHGALLFWLGVRYHRARAVWTERRLTMTHELVENLVGHRTRLAQERPEGRHLEEDERLEAWMTAARRMDRLEVLLQTLGNRGFVLLALAALAPAFVMGEASVGTLAVGVAAALLGQRAWGRLSQAMMGASAAVIAWQQAKELFDAAARPRRLPSPDVETLRSSPDAPLLEARALGFRHAGRAEQVLRDVNVRVERGARVLLEGPSGCGKSTLASIITGLRVPSAGLALLGGVDHNTLGSVAWRGRVASAPQFHENHILTGPLAFNVLLGRGWPAPDEQIAEAEELLRALGLGPLLERMPSGMMQVVGETGWQLSHGEKSRVFLARALLQGTELVVLDETFGALDPETMTKSLRVTFEKAPALVVIAHP